MKLGVHIGYWGLGLSSDDQREIVQEAERLGYDSVWAAEAINTAVEKAEQKDTRGRTQRPAGGAGAAAAPSTRRPSRARPMARRASTIQRPTRSSRPTTMRTTRS